MEVADDEYYFCAPRSAILRAAVDFISVGSIHFRAASRWSRRMHTEMVARTLMSNPQIDDSDNEGCILDSAIMVMFDLQLEVASSGYV